MRSACYVLLFVFMFQARLVHAESDAPTRPNIVFILSDDHRYDGFGASGNKQIVTPNIDAIAMDGIVFTYGAVGIPQCCPSRAALLTGLYSPQNGYYSNKNWTKEAEKGFGRPTAMELMQKAGYHTALIGKWHIKPLPWKCGFSEVRTWMPQGADAYVNPKLAHGMSDKIRESNGHVTELFADDAVRFFKERGRDKGDEPFFLWLAFTAPHTPQKPVPDRCCEPYVHLGREHQPPGFPPDVRRPGPWAQYYGAITHMDEQIGRVLNEIKAQGLEKNTIIFFVGDNGWMMGSHGRYGKNLPEDESARVPFMVKAPPQWQGWHGTSDAQITSLDLPPTWLSIAGMPVPEEWPGESLVPLMKDEKPQPKFRDHMFVLFDDEKEYPGSCFRMIRTKDFKYVLRPVRFPKDLKDLKKRLEKKEEEKDRKVPDLDHEQLFDLRNDPYEMKDVSRDPALSDDLKKLRATMEKELTRTGDPAIKWVSGQPVKITLPAGLAVHEDEDEKD